MPLARLRGVPQGRRILDALPATVAFFSAATALPGQRPLPLQPDAVNFLALADQFGAGSLWGGAREPLWPALLAGPVQLLGPHPTILRALGLLLFPLLVLAFQWLALAVLPPAYARAGALVLALSPWLRLQALEGLREVPATAGLLLFAGILLRREGRYAARGAVGLGAFAAVLALLRWDTVLITVPLLLLSVLLRRARLRHGALVLVTVMALTAPLTLGNAQRYDDPLFHSNVAAVFFRNHEFAGQPGLPTKEELVQDCCGGPHTTWFDYLFGYHSVPEVTRRTLTGGPSGVLDVGAVAFFSGDVLRGPELSWPTLRILRDNATLIPWLLLAGTVAGLAVLVRARRWHLTALALLAIFQLAPIEAQMDLRLGMAILPVSVLCTLVALKAAFAAREARAAPTPG